MFQSFNNFLLELKVQCSLIFHFQVNLEARVGFGSSVGKGLIEEVKSSSANILLLRGSRNSTNR